MRAVVYDGPRSVAVREVPTPEPGPGEVRVQVQQAGVCGTDLHIHEGGFGAAFPLTPGHEVVGVVSALGEGTSGLAEGDAVVVNPNISCGHCAFCREGRTLLCTELDNIGVKRPGGFAEHVVAPFGHVHPTGGLAPEVAVFTEPAACAVHGLESLAPRPGASALVFGAGPTGLLLAQLIARGGASHVTVAASSAFKLDRARALGVDATFLMDRGDLAGSERALLEASGGEGFDCVVEATGSAAVGEVCVPLTRSGGTVLVYGVTGPEDRVSFSPFDVFRREITIRGSFAEIDAFPAAIAALRGGRARTEGIVTHVFGLEDYARALEALRSDRSVHKVVLAP